MPRGKKIKVLDIIPENNENEPVNDEVEVVDETDKIVEANPQSDEKVEETIQETPEPQEPKITETPTEFKEEEPKNVRVQELVECPKCGKKMTAKTLKYSHEKVCPKNEKNPLGQVKPKQKKRYKFKILKNQIL